MLNIIVNEIEMSHYLLIPKKSWKANRVRNRTVRALEAKARKAGVLRQLSKNFTSKISPNPNQEETFIIQTV